MPAAAPAAIKGQSTAIHVNKTGKTALRTTTFVLYVYSERLPMVTAPLTTTQVYVGVVLQAADETGEVRLRQDGAAC